MDYSVLKKRVLQELRGKLSQMSFSQKLGYDYNKIGKWESGATGLKWHDFYACCEAKGVSLEKSLRDVFLYTDDPRDSQKIIKGLFVFNRSLSTIELAENLNAHPSVVKRWMSGTVSPDIEVIFSLMNVRPHLLSHFIASFIDIENVPQLLAPYKTAQTVKTNYADPSLYSVWLAFRLKAYQDLPVHDDRILADLCGLSVAEIKLRTEQLLRIEHIEAVGEKFRTCGDSAFTDMNGDKDFITQTHAYWVKRSLARVKKSGTSPTSEKYRPNLRAFFVTSVSKHMMKKISDHLHAALEQVMQMATADQEPEEEMRVILIDVFSPEDAPVEG